MLFNTNVCEWLVASGSDTKCFSILAVAEVKQERDTCGNFTTFTTQYIV